MACEWRDAKIMDVAEVNTTTYSTSEKWEYVNYLDTSNITSGHISEIQLISDTNTLPSRARRKVRAGDIVYSTVRPNQRHYGIIKNPSDNMLVSTGFAVLRGKSQISDTKFLYYFLIQDHVINQLQTIAEHSTSTYPSIRPGDIESLGLKLPALTEQQAIACILGALDDKIELNRRMNKTLEEMARAIFKSWFVDFEPVRAKAAGQTPQGLTPEIAALFPDSFEDSELGQIPKWWKIRSISDLTEVVGGSTPSTKNSAFWEAGIHCWATPKDLSSLTTPVLLNTARCITDAGLAQISSGLLPVGTVLLSSRAPIGYLAIAEIPVAINQGFIAMKPRNGVSNLFLLFWAHFSHEGIMSRANGSTFLEISKSNFRSMKLVIPETEIFKAFDRLVKPLYRRIVLNEHESHTLAILRDTFLPKLISGEIRLTDAEKYLRR
jgi:type I restriction enzyme S subunit